MGNVIKFAGTIVGKEMDKNTNRRFSIKLFLGNHNASYNIFNLTYFIPIFLLCIIGCSDVPYTGPVLTVDRYLNSTGEDTICLQDGFDSICLKVVKDENQDAPPIVHIYPASVVFIFYYEDRPILRAEKVMDTTDLIQQLVDAGQVQLPVEDEAAGNGNQEETDTAGEWVIDVYYPNGFAEEDRGTTLEISGLDIRVGEGKTLSEKPDDDLEIRDFKQIDSPNGILGVQFTVESEGADISIEVNGIIDEHIALFYVKADGVVSAENTHTFRLQPKDDL